MSKVNDVATLYKQLKAEWGATKPNLSKCGQLLSDLKVNCFTISRLCLLK